MVIFKVTLLLSMQACKFVKIRHNNLFKLKAFQTLHLDNI